MSLKGKVAVVCGASGVVGSGIARALGEQGAIVAVLVRSEKTEGVAVLKKYFSEMENQLFISEQEFTLEGIFKFRDKVLEKFERSFTSNFYELFSQFSIDDRIDTVFSSLGSWQTPGPLTELTEEQILQGFKGEKKNFIELIFVEK